MKFLEAILLLWTGLCLMVLLGVVFLDVLMRNLFNSPFIWGTDMTELIMGMMAFGALPLLSLRLRHLKVELLPVAEGSATMHFINVVVSLLTATVFLLVAWQFQLFAQRSGRTGEMLAQLGLRWTYVWWALFSLATLTVTVSLYTAVLQMFRMVRSLGRAS